MTGQIFFTRKEFDMAAVEVYLGEIRFFGFTRVPQGWTMCDGHELPIQQNAALYSLLGTAYGGNGTTTFCVPDLRGRVPLCGGQGPGTSYYQLGAMGGYETIILKVPQLPVHNHTAAAISQTEVTLSKSSLGKANATLKGTNGGSGEDKPEANVLGSGVQIYNSSPRSLVNMSDDSITIEMTEAPTYNAVADTSTMVQIQNTGQGVPIVIMQPFTALKACIALEGIYPS